MLAIFSILWKKLEEKLFFFISFSSSFFIFLWWGIYKLFFLCMIENQHLLQANVNIDPICTKRIRTSLHLCFLFAHTFHETSSASFFYTVKYFEMEEKELKGNIQMFDIKNHILWFCSFFPFVSFLFHSITQFGFTHSKTIKAHDFPCVFFSVIISFCFLVQYFCVENKKKLSIDRTYMKKKKHSNNNIMKYEKYSVLWPLIFEK